MPEQENYEDEEISSKRNVGARLLVLITEPLALGLIARPRCQGNLITTRNWQFKRQAAKNQVWVTTGTLDPEDPKCKYLADKEHPTRSLVQRCESNVYFFACFVLQSTTQSNFAPQVIGVIRSVFIDKILSHFTKELI